MTGKTFAVFRVDRKHHLMSLVSMIGKLKKNFNDMSNKDINFEKIFSCTTFSFYSVSVF